MNVDPTTLDTSGIQKYVSSGESQSILKLDVLHHLTYVKQNQRELQKEGLVRFHHLQMHQPPKFIDQVAHVFFNIVNMVMKLAPIGAFGAMAFTIGRLIVPKIKKIKSKHVI
jgi:aerobic C4-dicarboxylate transport protein